MDSARQILANPELIKGKILFAPVPNVAFSINDTFWAAASSCPAKLVENWDQVGEGASLLVPYKSPDTLQFLTPVGVGKISTIRYYYHVDTQVVATPPSSVRNYVSQTTGETISQTMEFEIDIPGRGIQTIRLHAVPTTDATKVGLSIRGPESA